MAVSSLTSLRMSILNQFRLAEVARKHGWHPPKSLDSDEKFKPEHTLFCHELRFVGIYSLFGDLWAKKVPFGVKNSFSWPRSALLHGIYCIFHIIKCVSLFTFYRFQAIKYARRQLSTFYGIEIGKK